MAKENAKTEERVQIGPELDVATELLKESAAIQQAVADGHIAADITDVDIRHGAQQNPTGKNLFGFYLRLLAMDTEGQLALCNGLERPSVVPKDEKGNTIPEDKRTAEQIEAAKVGACDWFNYGSDLERKQLCRKAILAAVEGPEKAIRKSFEGMILAGYDKAEAAAMLRNSPKFKDVDGLENLLARVSA
jgi:hypothetical protein